MRPHDSKNAWMRSTLAALTPPSSLRLSVPVRYTSGRNALASSSVLRKRMYDATPVPVDSDGGGTMVVAGGGSVGDSGRWWTSGSGVRVLACVTVGGGLRFTKNSGNARFSIESTDCRLNQLVRFGMDRVSSGGREAAVGEVGEVAAEVVAVAGG